MLDRNNTMLSGKMHWFVGVVEDINDPLMMGRVRVRIWGIHGKEEVIPRETLPWATVVMSGQSAAMSGFGWSMGYYQGTWVFGFFADGDSFQNPYVLGSILSQAGPPPVGWPPDRAVNRGDILDSKSVESVPVTPNFLAYLCALEQSCGLPSGSLYGVMMTESGGNPNAKSHAGAMGLFQLMPGTAKDMGVSDPYDPHQSAKGGAKYLCTQYKKYGNLDHALMAYNWGPGNVNKWLDSGKTRSVPTETRNYVPKVKNAMMNAPDCKSAIQATGTADNTVGDVTNRITAPSATSRTTVNDEPEPLLESNPEEESDETKKINVSQKIMNESQDVLEPPLDTEPVSRENSYRTYTTQFMEDVPSFLKSTADENIDLGEMVNRVIRDTEVQEALADQPADASALQLVDLRRIVNSQLARMINGITIGELVADNVVQDIARDVLSEFADSGVNLGVLENAISGATKRVMADALAYVYKMLDNLWWLELEPQIQALVDGKLFDRAPFKDPGGFFDPQNRFPFYPRESDVHRLARNDPTVTQPGGAVWLTEKNADVFLRQRLVPYNTKYPYNRMYFSEKGHILEFDDTPDYERVHMAHRSGTGFEVGFDGTQLDVTVGEKYSVSLKHNNIRIRGDAKIYVDGNANITVGCDVNLSAGNDMNLNVAGNMNVQVGNVFTLYAGGGVEVNSEGGIETISNGSTLISSMNELTLRSKGETLVTAESDVAISGANVLLNDPYKIPVAPTPPVKRDTTKYPEINYLFTYPFIHETTEDRYYLSNETSSVTAADVQAGLINGAFSGFDLAESARNSVEASESFTNRKETLMSGKTEKLVGIPDDLYAGGTVDYNTKLSNYYRLKDLTILPITSKYRIGNGQGGLTVRQIIENLAMLANNVIDKLYEKYHDDLLILSVFRRGNGKSQHLKGEAVDFQLKGYHKNQYYEEALWCMRTLPAFDQLLLEYKTTGTKLPWIHVSLKKSGNRNDTLTFFNHVKYKDGLHNLAKV